MGSGRKARATCAGVIVAPEKQNTILASLEAEDRALISSYLKPVKLTQGEVIDPPNSIVSHVRFPVDGILSVVAESPEGRNTEVGLVGREGLTGLALVTGGGQSPLKTFVQVEGYALSIEREAFAEALSSSARLKELCLLYIQALSTQTAYTAMAHRRAKLGECLARWLLMCHDRAATDDLAITHQFIADSLGVRRSGVTVALHLLEGRRAIRVERGVVRITDRNGLEREANGYYGSAEAEYRRLLLS